MFSALMIGVGALRDILTAAFFGASDAIDAFMLASSFCVCIYGILTSVIDTAFLPLYTERLKRRNASPASLLSSIAVATTCFLTVSTVAMIVFVPYYMPLIARGFSGDKLQMTEHFCQALLALVFLNGVSGLFKAVHNAHFRFGVPSFSNVVVPVFAVLFLFSFRETMGVWSLVWGAILGTAVKLTVMSPFVLEHLRQDGFPSLKGAELRAVLAFSCLAAPLILGVSFSRANAVVVQAIATRLPAGSVAMLAYADRVFQVPVNLIALPLWTSIFPYLSREWESRNMPAFRETLVWGFRVILIVVMPITLILVLGSSSVVGALYMRGAFGTDAARSTSLVLSISGIGLIPVSLGYLFGRALHAARKMWAFAGVSLLNVAVNGIACVLLSRWWGIAGIAAAGTITFTLSAFLLAALLRSKAGFVLTRGELVLVGKLALASLAMLCVGIGLGRLPKQGSLVPTHFHNWVSLLGWMTGVLTYFLIMFALGVEEVRRATSILVGWCKIRQRGKRSES